MCFISPKNVERKLENKEKKSNSKDSVTKLCYVTHRLYTLLYGIRKSSTSACNQYHKTPSSSSNLCLEPSPPPYPVKERSLPITR